MKNRKKHIIIGTVICAATMFLFLAFSNKLPENVPVQITNNGSVGNTLPKPLLVFGMPVVYAVVNLIRVLQLARKEDASTYNYYIFPGIAVILSIVTLWTGLSM